MRFNRRLIILCLFGLFLVFKVSAQNARIDSLKTELLQHKKQDSIKVNLLNALAFSFFSRDVKTSLNYLEAANTLAKSINFKKGIARSVYIKGITEATQSNFSQALNYYSEALNLYVTIQYKKGIANCYNAMGITLRNKGELRKSIEHFKEAITIEEEIGSNNLSASLLNLGTAYEQLGDLGEAIFYLKKAISIAESENNQERIAYSLNNLGIVYNIMGNYPLALNHQSKSLYINEKLGDSISMAHNLVSIGAIYKIQKYYDKAMVAYKRSLGIYERINSKLGVAITLNVMGAIYNESGNYSEALNHYLKALKLAKDIGANSETPYILNNIGKAYLTLKDYKKAHIYFTESMEISLDTESRENLCGAYLGLAETYFKQKAFNLAKTYATKAKNIAENVNLLEFHKQAYSILADVYKAKGAYKQALASHENFKILNDSIFNKENIQKITQLEYEYKYQKQLDSASIRELELTKTVNETNKDLAKTQRNYLWAVIGVLLISMILGSVIFFQKLKNAEAETKNAMIEQKLLRSQMTPHFIFNSLSVLQGMILNKENKKSVKYLSKFSKLMRLTLENSRDKTVLLSNELSAVENYLALQNLENQAYQYTIKVNDSVNSEALLVPPMLIQPFVENAVEHAFVDTISPKKIDVILNFSNHKLICTITDNGVGINANQNLKNSKKTSLSTKITSERLKMLSTDFNMKGWVTIEDLQNYNKQGTMVTLLLPYKLVKVV
ncbi:hypothetical protein PK35_09030 [Tamlana nanhaiensis]|uniref:Signal transduction histidine kinase internal region domain-containing protein n=1 Tax=Neotamlana nanhaiensis TaxID=1382798 RepID=A0A0D7W217_9FLAO|nr:tetratricopeptide repeat protein [Tamlana nanhaiensis]KJD33094.1 hypothetical protein PK35_09030 [Tamlana nanhaiensis]